MINDNNVPCSGRFFDYLPSVTVISVYCFLCRDSNEQIDRIMAKLTTEQTIRVNAECQYTELLDKYNILEEQLEAAQKAVTAASDDEAPSSSSGFGSYFNSSSSGSSSPKASSANSPISKRSSWTNLMSGAAAKMFSDSGPSYQRTAQSSQALQSIIQAQSKQLQALTQANAKLQTSDAQVQYELECTKEQYDTLLVMKDNILKTILAENKELVDQKEAFMSEQHEHLATIEQLTYLLRNSMQRKATEIQMPVSKSYESELSEMDEENFVEGTGLGLDNDSSPASGYVDEDEVDEETQLDGVDGGEFEAPVRDDESLTNDI